jgi:G3E family GTPase
LLIRAHFGQVAPRDLFGAGFFYLGRKSLDVQRWLNDEAYEHAVIGDVQHGNEGHRRVHRHRHTDTNRHDDHIRSFCIDVEQPIPWDVFKQWYEELAEKKGGSLLRVKGIVDVAGEAVPFMIHCVQATQHEPTPLTSWPDENRRSRIVFITHDLPREEIEADLRGGLRWFQPRINSGQAFESTSPPDNAAAGRWLS